MRPDLEQSLSRVIRVGLDALEQLQDRSGISLPFTFGSGRQIPPDRTGSASELQAWWREGKPSRIRVAFHPPRSMLLTVSHAPPDQSRQLPLGESLSLSEFLDLPSENLRFSSLPSMTPSLPPEGDLWPPRGNSVFSPAFDL
jgi:hypothetical protein